MKIVRNAELEPLIEKLSEKLQLLSTEVKGVSVSDPKEGDIWDLKRFSLPLRDGKLKEPFTEIDDIEIGLLSDSIKKICSQIRKIKNYQFEIYTEQYTDHLNLNDDK